MCSGTKYSHENFFIHKMFLIFCYFYSGCSYWGLRLLDCSLVVFLLPIKYGKKLLSSFHHLIIKHRNKKFCH